MNAGRLLSAGGVVFRPVEGGVEVALILVSKGKGWCLPKGLVESGEGLARTAHREVREETGLDARILRMIGNTRYFFQIREPNGYKRVFKIVYFFLMEYISGDVSNHDDEVDDCRWFPMDTAIKLMKFEDEKDIIRRARAMLRGLGFAV